MDLENIYEISLVTSSDMDLENIYEITLVTSSDMDLENIYINLNYQALPVTWNW